MESGQRRSRGVLRLVNSIIDLMLLTAVSFLALYGGYAIWDSHVLTENGSAKRYEQFKPAAERESFGELQRENPEVIGWLEVFGTSIDYPLVQARDDWKYISTDARGNYSLTGALFMSSVNQKDFSDFNSIIYGHNMTPKVMFGNIKDFKEKDYFEQHRYGALYDGVSHYGIEFFAVLSADAYDGRLYRVVSGGADERKAYIDYIRSLALHQRELPPEEGERIILLSTCSNVETNGRELLVGKITRQTFTNVFAKEKEEADPVAAVTGDTLEWWKRLGATGKVLILIGLIGLICLFWRGALLIGKKKAKDQGHEER